MHFFAKLYKHILWKTNYTFQFTIPQFFLSYFLTAEVKTGLFAGMKYLRTSVGSVVLPKLIGTYENELDKIFRMISDKDYKCFIDIGAAEGFYAVGVKKYIFPNIEKAVAFEATKAGQRLIKKLAHLNQVNGIAVKGFCSLHTLSEELKNRKKTFILVDIEGSEYDLLNPELINFTSCDLLIEMHPINDKVKEQEFVNKFSNTHYITIIEKKEKKLPKNVLWHHLIKKYENYVVNEFRGKTSWLFLQSKG